VFLEMTKHKEKKQKEHSERSGKSGQFKATLVTTCLIFGVLAFLFLAVFAPRYGETQTSHAEGMDYSHYITRLSVLIGCIAGVWLLAGILAHLTTGRLYKVATISFCICAGVLVLQYGYACMVTRAWSSDAETDIIELQTTARVPQATLDLGNYTVLAGYVEDYQKRDDSAFDKSKCVFLDDMWRIVIQVNNTANWNQTNQNLTGVTVRLKGYLMPEAGSTSFQEATGWISPNTQVGSANYGDSNTAVFEGIEQDERMGYFVFEVLNNDSTVLGRGYVYPRIEMEELSWFMKLT
jgi:hypothetical protein